MIEFDNHDIFMFDFEDYLILRFFCDCNNSHNTLCIVSSSVDTHNFLYVISRDRLFLDRGYVIFQGFNLEFVIAIVYKTEVSFANLFKPWYSPPLERADFISQRFQTTWLNSNFCSSPQESMKPKHT